MSRSSGAPDRVPGGADGSLGDADEQQGQPAQDDVGADAFFLAVVDRAQVDDLLEVSPAALDFQELLAAERDVLGGQPGIGGAEQVLPVKVLLGLDLGRIDPQQAARGDAQVPVQARLLDHVTVGVSLPAGQNLEQRALSDPAAADQDPLCPRPDPVVRLRFNEVLIKAPLNVTLGQPVLRNRPWKAPPTEG